MDTERLFSLVSSKYIYVCFFPTKQLLLCLYLYLIRWRLFLTCLLIRKPRKIVYSTYFCCWAKSKNSQSLVHICILSKALVGAPEQMVFGESAPANFNETPIFACNSVMIFGMVVYFKKFWHTVRINCPIDQEKHSKFEAEGWEFAKYFDQYIRTVKSQNNFWNRILFQLGTGGFFSLDTFGKTKMTMGNWM